MNEKVKIGALIWPQFTDWASMRSMAVTADRVGYDNLWTWDHVYPIIGNPNGPIFEGWSTLVAWAEATKNVRIGLMVGANTFREPALTAKLATTLDHISGGRLNFGIAASGLPSDWAMFNVDGMSGQNRDMTREALDIILKLWSSTEPFDYKGKFWHVTKPDTMFGFLKPHIKPLQAPHPPIGVAGLSKGSDTLKLAGEGADSAKLIRLVAKPSADTDCPLNCAPTTVARPSAETVNSNGAAALRRGPMLPRYSAMPSAAMASASRQRIKRKRLDGAVCILLIYLGSRPYLIRNCFSIS